MRDNGTLPTASRDHAVHLDPATIETLAAGFSEFVPGGPDAHDAALINDLRERLTKR